MYYQAKKYLGGKILNNIIEQKLYFLSGFVSLTSPEFNFVSVVEGQHEAVTLEEYCLRKIKWDIVS